MACHIVAAKCQVSHLYRAPQGRPASAPQTAPQRQREPRQMSRRYTATPLDLNTVDPRSGVCRHCGEPLPARKPTRGRPPVTCSSECKRRYTNAQKWAARIQRARAANRLTHDRSDGTPSWAASPRDVQTYDDDEGSYSLEGYGIVLGDLDDKHRKELKDAVNAWEAERAAERRRLAKLEAAYLEIKAQIDALGRTLDEHLAATGKSMDELLADVGYCAE